MILKRVNRLCSRIKTYRRGEFAFAGLSWAQWASDTVLIALCYNKLIRVHQYSIISMHKTHIMHASQMARKETSAQPKPQAIGSVYEIRFSTECKLCTLPSFCPAAVRSSNLRSPS